MASQLKPIRQPAIPGDILCDACIHPKHKAVQTCLQCLSSYCRQHIQPHQTMSGLMTHQLIEPRGNLQERQCSLHHKQLELFCTRDQVPVCMLCLYHDHKAHEVVSLAEAATQQKLQLKKTETVLEQMISNRELKIQELRTSMQTSNANADGEINNSIQLLTVLKEAVERVQQKLIQEICSKKQATEDTAKGFIIEMEREISLLKKRRNNIKRLSQSDDHFHLLQNVQNTTVPATKDWRNVSILTPTYMGTVARVLNELNEDLIKTTEKVFKSELKRAKTLEKDVKLDSATAHPQLVVSRNRKHVVHNDKRIALGNSRRFDELFVLGQQSFSESFYFEAVVEKKTEWILGVAEESVQRKGFIQPLQSKNGFWTIGMKYDSYYVSDDLGTSLSTKCTPKRIGVFVDRQEGLISFYDVDAVALMHSFTDTYHAKKLQLICSPGKCGKTNSAPLIVTVPYGRSVPAIKLHKLPKRTPLKDVKFSVSSEQIAQQI